MHDAATMPRGHVYCCLNLRHIFAVSCKAQHLEQVVALNLSEGLECSASAMGTVCAHLTKALKPATRVQVCLHPLVQLWVYQLAPNCHDALLVLQEMTR